MSLPPKHSYRCKHIHKEADGGLYIHEEKKFVSRHSRGALLSVAAAAQNPDQELKLIASPDTFQVGKTAEIVLTIAGVTPGSGAQLRAGDVFEIYTDLRGGGLREAPSVFLQGPNFAGQNITSEIDSNGILKLMYAGPGTSWTAADTVQLTLKVNSPTEAGTSIVVLRSPGDGRFGTEWRVFPVNVVPAGSEALAGQIGPQGPAGPQGAQGLTGAAGPTGPQGPRGDEGPAGAVGPMGPAGPKGDTGATGLVGPVGPAGPVGPVGLTGATGATGSAGPVGPAGPQGLTGATGATGPAGPVGPAGPAGAIGPAGPAGATGATGAAGPKVFLVRRASKARPVRRGCRCCRPAGPAGSGLAAFGSVFQLATIARCDGCGRGGRAFQQQRTALERNSHSRDNDGHHLDCRNLRSQLFRLDYRRHWQPDSGRRQWHGET